MDDFIGFGTPGAAQKSFDTLHKLLTALGLTISDKKLLRPQTSAVCLYIYIYMYVCV